MLQLTCTSEFFERVRTPSKMNVPMGGRNIVLIIETLVSSSLTICVKQIERNNMFTNFLSVIYCIHIEE